MEITNAMRRSPAYAQYYYSQMSAKNKSIQERKQADDLANWAKTSGYLGKEQQLGIPSSIPELQTQPGTGIYSDGFNPDRREMMLRNQALLASGVPSLQEQGMSQMGTMQTSRNSGINSINLEKWKKDNLPRKADTKLEQLYQLRDRLEPGDPRISQVDSAINKEATRAPRQTTQLSIGEDGSVNFYEGAPGGMAPMGKPTTNIVEKEAYDAAKSLDRLDMLNANFDKDFLTYQGRLEAWGIETLDKMGKDPTPEQADYLIKYGQFRADSVDNMAKYIQSISGAAVTEQEAKRLQKSLPDAVNDSPTMFKAKMLSARKRAKIAMVRAIYTKSTGGNPLSGDITLSQMETIYNKRRDVLRDKYIRMLNTDSMNDSQKMEAKSKIIERVKADLKEEFGA